MIAEDRWREWLAPSPCLLLLVMNANERYDSAYSIRNREIHVNSWKEVEMTEGDGEAGLPASIEYAWGLQARPVKGPKRGLSIERIVEAGVAIAEAEGI